MAAPGTLPPQSSRPATARGEPQRRDQRHPLARGGWDIVGGPGRGESLVTAPRVRKRDVLMFPARSGAAARLGAAARKTGREAG